MSNYVVSAAGIDSESSAVGSFESDVAGYLTTASDSVVEYANALDGTNNSTSGTSSSDTGGGLFGFLDVAMSGVGDVMNDFTNPGNNPVAWLYHLGLDCFNVVSNVMIESSLLIFGVAITGYFCSSENPLGSAFKAYADWMQPFYIGHGRFIYGCGFDTGILCAAIPLYGVYFQCYRLVNSSD